jgi:hypothetical protein
MTDALFEVEWRDPRMADRERRIRLIIEECRRTPEWPVDDLKDRTLAVDLIAMYPTANLPELIRAWRSDWAMRKATIRDGKGVNLRERIKTWCRNWRGWQQRGRKIQARNRGGGRAGSTAPRTAEDFDGEDGTIRSW